MEDTHVWLVNADGTNRRELGAALDNRQGPPQWVRDGAAVYFTAQEHGNVHLYKLSAVSPQPSAVPASPQIVVGDRGSVGAFSVAPGGAVAYAYSSPADQAELHLKPTTGAARQFSQLNDAVLAGKTIAPVDSFWFVSNDNKYQVQAFLTQPVGLKPDGKYPLIVVAHGGPHGQQGPAFNPKNQVYAARGWATLLVNFRGSTGYGQAWADAVFGDQNGNEAQDVLYGLSAAMRRNLWIDRDRLGIEGGSYGGQLANWLITQTNIFKAAIPLASISNLVSYNYMTYYNQYEQMEFGIFPHQGNLMDELWRRSALRYVAQAHTPTMLVHGENDNDVPIAEAEQYYVALRDVGVEAIMVRYPREGHGLAEPKHNVDLINRSIEWYEKHFPAAGAASTSTK
jgi:dipeptidyl aminopeptidase/acylaminoacyl peptidase